MLDSLKDRWQFASSDDEQRYETRLISERRFYNQIALYPVNFMHDRILRPDRPAVWGFVGKAAAWRFLDQWMLKATGGQLLRSMTTGYDKRQNYQSAKETAGMLIGLAVGAEAWDDGSLTPISEIQQAQGTPLKAMLDASGTAGDLIEQFLHGELQITPSNVAQLETQCRSMAALCQMRASLLAHPDTQEPAAPIELMRDMLSKPKLETARDAQLMLALGAALLVDGAIPFSSEMYVPQDEVYLTADQSVALRKAITMQPPAAGASKQTVLDFAQKLRGEVQQIFGPKLPKLLDFAETHQTMMEKLLVPEAMSADAATERFLLQTKQQLQPVHSGALAWHAGGAEMANPFTALTALRTHIMRPEATHEMHKLYGRNLANQILALPTGIVEEVMRNFFENSVPGKPKSGFDALVDRMNGHTDTPMKRLFNADHFTRTLNSKGFHFIAKPVAASAVTVGVKDVISGMGPALAIEAADRSHLVLRDGLHGCLLQDDGLREQLALLQKPNPTLIALLQQPDNQALLGQLLTGKPLDTAADYEKLAGLFDQVGQLASSTAHSVWQSLSPDHQAPSFAHSLHALATQPVQTPAQAVLAFAFIDTFMQASREAHAMSEFVNPKEIPLSAAQLRQLGQFIESQSKAAHFSSATPAQDWVRLANVIMDKARDMGVVTRMEALLESSYHDKPYLDHVMQHVVAEAGVSPNKPAVAAVAVDASLTRPWQGQTVLSEDSAIRRVRDRLKQPEVDHEKQKLYDRQQGEKGIGAISSVVENSLRNGNALLDRGNLVNAAWTYLMHPYVYGHGIVQARETLDELIFHKETTNQHAQAAVALLRGLERSAAAIDPDLRGKLAQAGIANASLATLGNYHHIPALAAKPEAERTATDTQKMTEFFEQCGDAIISGYGGLCGALLSEAQPISLKHAVERSVGAPVSGLSEAVLGSGFLSLLIKESSAQQNRLRYLPPQETLLSQKALLPLASYVLRQAEAAGLTVADERMAAASSGMIQEGDLVVRGPAHSFSYPDAQTLIRFNNVVTEKMREITRSEPGKDVTGILLHGALSDKMMQSMQHDVLPTLSR